jgi:molybdopterin-containing oxidoreductase family iron-sulfur binding subunit
LPGIHLCASPEAEPLFEKIFDKSEGLLIAYLYKAHICPGSTVFILFLPFPSENHTYHGVLRPRHSQAGGYDRPAQRAVKDARGLFSLPDHSFGELILGMNRRTFLKIAGMGSIAFAAGCNNHPEKNLFTLVQAPDDMVVGEATFYASTCRQCPAGCGILAKNREGRVIKLEGNPLHPLNQGKICIRGQAALQSLYHPDRIKSPLLKRNGTFQKISFEQALSLIRQTAEEAQKQGPDRVHLLTEVVGDSLLSLAGDVLSRLNAKRPLVFEPFAYESLKFACQQAFGAPMLPGLQMEDADFLLSLGADFLETWLSPVEYAIKFKAMHSLADGRKGRFVHVSPFESLTAANADRWLACRPGGEAAVAMGLIREAFAAGRGSHLPTAQREALATLAQDYPPETVAQLAEVSPKDFGHLSARILAARRPLILGTGVAASGPLAVPADLAAILLNCVLDPDLSLFYFDQRHQVELARSRAEIQAFFDALSRRPANLLLLNHVNPVYSLPEGQKVAELMQKETLLAVAFSDFMDDTAAAADLIFPTQMPLERWDAYESKTNWVSMLQPTMGPLSQAPNLGDILISLLPADQRPAPDYMQYLARRLLSLNDPATSRNWLELVQAGGRFPTPKPAAAITLKPESPAVETLARCLKHGPTTRPSALTLIAAPSIRYFDGRDANRPWLNEAPDPISMVAWQSVGLIHPETLDEEGWATGDVLLLRSATGERETPVCGYEGLNRKTIVIPIGLGHGEKNRHGGGQGINPLALLPPDTDPDSGAPIFQAPLSALNATGRKVKLAKVSGSPIQHGRKIALTVAFDHLTQPESLEKAGLAMDDFPFTPPLPEGYAPSRDFYPAHAHVGYRWGMVVDLDRCIGCSACVAACYAENNVGVVGEEQIIKGREMAWLRIERYQDPKDMTQLIFLPMLCQHCDNAPCESVCPVFAPHHSKEGLNNQIYNRCIGTRFCAQNCPYKVRRFNWFDWQWPEPFNMQLNPDVTVRSKGVMEKCSFCIQRIKAAHGIAKNEQREIDDGEVVPACVQTCPTTALIFGNLMDPGSRVRRLLEDRRAYQVMGYLNTKPAVIYLKKIRQAV